MSPLVLLSIFTIGALAFIATLNSLDLASLKGKARLSPEQFIILCRLSRAERLDEIKECITFHYQPLYSRIMLLISMAPSVGLFYTIVGLIAVMIKQTEQLDHGQMLSDMGVALGSTACSSIILISQLILLRRLNRVQTEDYLREKLCIAPDSAKAARKYRKKRRQSEKQLTEG